MDRCPGCSAGSPGGRRAMLERCNRRSNKSRSETLFLIDVEEVARPRAMIMIEQPLRRNLARSDDLLKRIKIARFVIARPVKAGTGGKIGRASCRERVCQYV